MPLRYGVTTLGGHFMDEKSVLKIVADKAADDMQAMSSFVWKLTAHRTDRGDAAPTTTEGYYFDCATLKRGHRTYLFGSSGNRVGKSNGECGLKADRD